MSTTMSTIIAYIAVNGDDQTGALGDPARPFKTIKAAQAALEPRRATNTVQLVDLGYVQSPQ